VKLQTEKIYNMIFAMRWGLCPRGRGVLSLGSGCGVDWGAPEAPPARPRTAGPPAGWAFDRAQPHRTESLRRPPIIAASSRWVSARSVHPQSRGPPSPPHRGGLSTRSCGRGGLQRTPILPIYIGRGRRWHTHDTILLWWPPATGQVLGTATTTWSLFLTTSWGLPTSTARLYSARCAESLKTPRRPTWEWRSRARIISEHGETSDSVHVNVSEVREHAPSHSHPSEPSNPPPRLYIPM
jgi:hypothetical protein